MVEAEEITVKWPDVTGAMVDAKLHLSRNNIYLEGKKLEKTGESSYRIEDGMLHHV